MTRYWGRPDEKNMLVELVDFTPAERFAGNVATLFSPVEIGEEDPQNAVGNYVLENNAWKKKESPPEKSLVEIMTELIQMRLDRFAQTRGYDGILSAASYAASANARFRAEGQYAARVRDASWARAYELLAEFEAGLWPVIPPVEEILQELPALAWPEAPTTA